MLAAIEAFEVLVAQQPNVPDFQSRLARSYVGLGAAFGRANRLDESETATRRAIAAYEELLVLRPNRPSSRAA
jgi:hypothetical protein